MNIRFNYILFIAAILTLGACKKDNYDAPTAKLSGRIVYQGEAIQVEYDRVPYELYQYGFGKVGPINGTVAPDGTYSHLLFNGEYKLVFRPGQGPFLWPQTGGKADSITINMTGSQQRDIEVMPYWMIRNPQLTAAGNTVTGKFALQKIITDANAKDVERVNLYINKTQFVSGTDNIARSEIAGNAITDLSNITMTVAIPTITPTQNYVFARIGLKMVGVEDMIFSPVVKITL